MKRIITIVTALVLAAGLSGRMEAKPVDKASAASIAARVLNKAVVNATPVRLDGCFLFTGADGKGFVLMAADDRVRPVLAYSPDGSFDPDAMPDHVAAWIDGYRQEITSVVETTADPSPKVTKEWERWSEGPIRDNSTWVDPLMTSRWYQAEPYSNYCPYDPDSLVHCPTGCVATAMAQIMRYWHWPEVGYSSYSYNWANYGTLSADFGNTYYNWDMMPDTLSTECSNEEIDAVATLMYHAGVSVSMMYTPVGSGSYSISSGGLDFPCAENALKTYFRYNPMLHGLHKGSYSDAEWDAMVRDELDAGRPVFYTAIDPNAGGHAFVLDGYDSIGMFHVNWGWAGHYDAWYLIDSLAPGAGSMGGDPLYCFNSRADALFGLYPAPMPTGEPSTISVISNDPTLGTVTGSDTYQTYDTVNVEVSAAEGCRYVTMATGKRNIPFSFLAIGQDYDDTAYFERITGDTIAYSYDYNTDCYPYGLPGTIEWGMRIPTSMRQGKGLTAVQMYCLTEGDYTLNIYEGETLNGNTPVYTKTYYLDGWQGWRTLELDSILSFAPEQTVWVTFSFDASIGSGTPIATTSYCGNPDGSWYHFSQWSDSWDVYTNLSVYITWMLRAVLTNTTSIEENVAESTGFAFISDGQIIITDIADTCDVSLQIVDMTGRVIVSYSGHTRCVPTAGMAPGVYVLRLMDREKVRTQKIVIP
jgi:hypothetical protein